MSFASGKVALITGAASGIGLCIVKELLRNELKGVTIADIDLETGKHVARILSEEFGQERILFVKTDVACQQDVEDAFEKTIRTFNNIDIVINSAGIFDDKAFEKSVAINLCGTIRTSFIAMEHYLLCYKSSSEALLINISSICGLEQFALAPVYVATKYGVIGFSRSLGTDDHYKRTGVRVLTICPGITETPIIITEDNQFFNLSYKDKKNDNLSIRPKQKPEVIAEALETIINEGETGSVWIVEGGIINKVNFPDLLGHTENVK